jgi:DNA-binding transcriptional ArsR family regulator
MQDDLDRTLAALSDPTRRAMVALLRRPRRASEIADALSMTRPATSRHLKVLRRAGVVTEHGIEDDARVRVYELRREAFGEMRAWLDDVEAFWRDQLGAFAAHVEARRKGKPKRARR